MIIITGASRGIGKFLFHSFRAENESLIGTYFKTPPEPGDGLFQVDVTSYEQVSALVTQQAPKLTDITLINCAGINYNAFAHKSDPLKWKEVVETNLIGTYNWIRAVLPLMREQKFGRIINFSSVVAVRPTPGISPYAASKSALWGMTRSIAVENAAMNVTINNINMGYSVLGMIEMVPEEYKKSIIAQIPAGCLCEPADILNTVKYIRATRYLTGSSIDLNGGLI